LPKHRYEFGEVERGVQHYEYVRALERAALAFEEAHENACGCDEPGRVTYCIAGPEFSALVDLYANGGVRRP
jgi:hypothetical protein